MASWDYIYCAVCGSKVFHDGDFYSAGYEYAKDREWLKVLCDDCAEKWELKAVVRDETQHEDGA